jgi:hypothetical protein
LDAWIGGRDRSAFTTIADVIRSYRGIAAVAASTSDLLDTLVADIGTGPLAQVDYPWAEAWIRAMKRERQLAPGTIRKRRARCRVCWIASSMLTR